MFNVFSKFKVSVTNQAGKIDIVVNPKPVCTDKKYIPAVQKTIQHVIFRHGEKNTPAIRSTIKKELTEQIQFFYKEGMIRPFDPSKDSDNTGATLDEATS